MALDTVFNSSFEDYKKNFKITSLATLFFKLLPLLIITPLLYYLVTVPSIQVAADFTQDVFSLIGNNQQSLISMTGNAVLNDQPSMEWDFFSKIILIYLRAIPLYIVLSIFSIIFSVIILYSSFNNKDGKLTFKESLRKSIRYFWKYLGLVLFIFLLLVALFIVTGILAFALTLTIIGVVLIPFLFIGFFVALIYFAVSWSFALYFIFDESSGIIEALGKSRKLVKGNFWRVVGYMLILFLILLIASLVFQLISTILTYPLGSDKLDPSVFMGSKEQILDLMTKQALKALISNFIQTVLAALTTVPFTIFFLKNFYLELKKEKMTKKETGIPGKNSK